MKSVSQWLKDDWKNRRDKISIVLNQAGTDETRNNTSKLGNGHRTRYPILKEWILDKPNDDIKVVHFANPNANIHTSK